MAGSRQKQVDAKGSQQPSMYGVLKRMLSTPPARPGAVTHAVMTSAFKSFREGFVGSFALAGAIVMAIIGVASAFIHGDSLPSPQRGSTAQR